MSMIAVCKNFQEDGTILKHILLCKLDCLSNLENIVSVDLDSGNDISSHIKSRVGRSSFNRCSHTEEVILDEVDSRKFPEVGHVSCFVELSLVGSTITKEHQSAVWLGKVFLSERKPSSNWDLGSDNSVPAVEVGFLPVVVHGATFSVRRACSLCEHLRHDLPRRISSQQCDAMVSVGCDDAVIKIGGCVNALVNGFLAISKMKETSNQPLLIQPVAAHLHPSLDIHAPEVT